MVFSLNVFYPIIHPFFDGNVFKYHLNSSRPGLILTANQFHGLKIMVDERTNQMTRLIQYNA